MTHKLQIMTKVFSCVIFYLSNSGISGLNVIYILSTRWQQIFTSRSQKALGVKWINATFPRLKYSTFKISCQPKNVISQITYAVGLLHWPASFDPFFCSFCVLLFSVSFSSLTFMHSHVPTHYESLCRYLCDFVSFQPPLPLYIVIFYILCFCGPFSHHAASDNCKVMCWVKTFS